jgi:hypothetical protein
MSKLFTGGVEMCEFKKGDDVLVWNYRKDFGMNSKFYLFDEDLKFPYIVVTQTGGVEGFRYCEKIQPKIAPGTRVLVGDGIRRYATGKVSSSGQIECWVDGGDEWSSRGQTSHWPCYTIVD